MRTGYDAKRAFHNLSGLGNYSRNIITLMSRYYPSDEYYLYTPGIRENTGQFLPSGAILRTPETFLSKKFGSVWRSVCLAKSLQKDRIDIYHGLSNELPLKIKGTGVRSVVTIHDLIFIRFPELYNRIDRNIYRRKVNYAVRTADRTIAISEQTKRDIIEFTNIKPEKISVIYQSVDPAFGKKSDSRHLSSIRDRYNLPADFMLYVGTIEKRKNLLNVVRAMVEGRVDLPLVVIGRETEYASEVHAYIRKHDVRNVLFLKNVPSDDLPSIYQLAILFVYPSSYEGFGIPVLEAITSGIPVIAGKGSCLEETGGPDSVYVDPLDIGELSVQIKRLAGDEHLRRTMVEKGKRFAEQFSGENTTRKLHELYESLI